MPTKKPARPRTSKPNPQRPKKARPRPQKPKPPTASTPPVPTYVPPPSNGFAVASLASALVGCTFVPVVGGLAAVVLGAIALAKERQDPTRYSAGGLAIVGMAIGGFTTFVPLLFVTLFAAHKITPLPFVLLVGFGAYVFIKATRGRTTTGQKVAMLGGGTLAIVLAIAATIGLAFGFYFLAQHIAIEVGRSIGDAFGHMFDSIGDAFGSCGNL